MTTGLGYFRRLTVFETFSRLFSVYVESSLTRLFIKLACLMVVPCTFLGMIIVKYVSTNFFETHDTSDSTTYLVKNWAAIGMSIERRFIMLWHDSIAHFATLLSLLSSVRFSIDYRIQTLFSQLCRHSFGCCHCVYSRRALCRQHPTLLDDGLAGRPTQCAPLVSRGFDGICQCLDWILPLLCRWCFCCHCHLSGDAHHCH